MYDFSSELRPTESLLWSGQPSNIKILDEEYKISIIIKTIILSLVFIALMVVYAVNAVKDPNGKIQISLMLIIAIIGVLANSGSVNQVKKLQKEYSYAITNERIIIHSDMCRSIDYNEIKKAAIVTDSANQTSILLNKAAESKPKNIRLLAEKCAMEDGDRFKSSVALYAIPNANAVTSLLEEYLPLL